MRIEEVQKCSFQNWYYDFKKVTIKSIILPLPKEFVLYILKDGIVLPKSCQAASYSVPLNDSESDDDSKETWENTETDEPEAPHFPKFDDSIKDAIEALGGKVFPKLNWSSPQDASWISFNNSLCCSSVSDIYLLLKSSDFVIHDLTQGLVLCDDYIATNSNTSTSEEVSEEFVLVLRKWTEIDTSGEFRCFVQDNSLIGICQREDSLYFDHISVYQHEILEDILLFYQQHIQSNFPLDHYVFDVYRKKKGRVYLIDFNPFDLVTQSLLFSWEELKAGLVKSDQNGLPEFRYVDDNHGVQPSSLSHFAVPSDIVDISTGEDSFKLVDLLKLKIDEQNDSSDDEAGNDWKV